MPATRSELGQFFTPRAVIDFALAALGDLGAQVASARACDPACGPGEWLLSARDAGCRELFGIDCDPSMVERWKDSGLIEAPDCRLLVGDGLEPGARLSESFDLVLGNPPFGAQLHDARDGVVSALATHYRLPFLSQSGTGRIVNWPSAADRDRLRRFPTEVLFLERFVELCRPGGWIAIVLPEGVLSNSRWRSVRRWLLARISLDLVVELPRAAFRASSTRARTCLMVMHKQPPVPEHTVHLCAVEACEPETLDTLRQALFDPDNSTGMSLDAPQDEAMIDLTPPIFRS